MMWLPATKHLSFTGNVKVSVGPASAPLPLKGVMVDVYRFFIDELGEIQFEHLSQIPARTDATGSFEFINLPVSVTVQTVIPSTPPYEPVELIYPNSLPNLTFRISVEAEVLTGSISEGSQFVDIYDERDVINEQWRTSHPERLHVLLTGSPTIEVLIPEGNEEATIVAGISIPSAVPGNEFHFLRIGRAIRQEIGELGDARPEYVAKAGYMRSSNKWTVTPSEPSFFPDQIDAPFGRTLHIGGHFGADFLIPPLAENLYYTVSFSEYNGDPSLPFNPAHLTNAKQIMDPLFNKKYILPTPTLPKGKWETYNLGPFHGTITSVEDLAESGLVGTDVKVYKRPPLPNLATEYWPFWDLMVIWISSAAPNGLAILTIEVYEKTNGADTSPELRKRVLDPSINDHLPLYIDNRHPVPKFLPYDLTDPDKRKFHTADAEFIGVLESVGLSTPMDICNKMGVTPGDTDGNECILVRYSVEDGSGNPHQHLNSYYLWVEYTPKAVPNAPDSRRIGLKSTFSGFEDISDCYYHHPAIPASPIMEVDNFRSVIVPEDADGWPPEPCGDKLPGSTLCDPLYPCEEYAVEVSLGCSVRTVNGWSTIFGHPHVSRHIIIKKT